MKVPIRTFFLFDGALLHDTALHDHILQEPEIRLLYEDQGPLAARVGPLLLLARQEVAEMISQLATSNSELVFGYNLLRSAACLDQIEQHLQQLRFIHAVSGKRYYFRFADGRAFANVWRALSLEQRQAMMGPVQEWHHYDPAGTQCCGRTAPQQSTSPASALPLQLQPDQWHQVLNATRVGELFLATSKVNYGPPAQGTRADIEGERQAAARAIRRGNEFNQHPAGGAKRAVGRQHRLARGERVLIELWRAEVPVNLLEIL